MPGREATIPPSMPDYERNRGLTPISYFSPSAASYRQILQLFGRVTVPGWSRLAVIRSKRQFWVFQAVFWMLAAIALFLYGLTYGHAQVALVRNLYNPAVGLACSYLMGAAYESLFPRELTRRLLLIVGLSILGAVVSALVVNPITFGLLGYDIGRLSPASLMQDGLYFVLLYLLWSVLYLQLTGKSLATTEAPAVPGMGSISVTKGNRAYKLDPMDIICIKASGDYVELCTSEESYLKHGTISSYERSLSPELFVRIHRSTIVNREKVASVNGPSKGQFWIVMEDGRELRSSRNYREAIDALLPEAR